MTKYAHQPRVFIGSSAEALHVAKKIQVNLDQVAECTVWPQSVFRASETAIGSLERAARNVDWAIFVVAPDDLLTKQNGTMAAPRDNVVFEIGFFMGAVGSRKTCLVRPEGCDMHLPSDLNGLTIETYRDRSDGNLEAALGKVCTRLEEVFADPAWRDRQPPPGSLEQTSNDGPPRPRRRRSLGMASRVKRSEEYQIVDISETGALLETCAGPVPLGTPMNLNLDLDGNVAEVRGCVVRVQQPDWGRVGGVAVKFEHIPGFSKDLIRRYVHADGVS